jgi:hypothetical protein
VDASPSGTDADLPPDACTTCPANDGPEGAQPIIGSGQITASFAAAHDDHSASCGGNGGRDLFFDVVVPVDQVVYLDTLAQTSDRVLALYQGACGATLGAELACSNNPCAGTGAAQLGRSLTAGTYCLVVDEGTPTSGDALELDVTFAGRAGTELTGNGPWQVTGDSCTGTDLDDADDCMSGNNNAKDVMYWFAVCPGDHNLRADTCTNLGYDSVIYFNSVSDELSCSDDGCTSGRGSRIQVDAQGAGLVMLVVDGYNAACGTFTLNVAK